MIEAIIVGGILAILAGAGTLTVTVYRLKGVVENGLTDDIQEIKAEQVVARTDRTRFGEEQARQGVRLDSIHKQIVGE